MTQAFTWMPHIVRQIKCARELAAGILSPYFTYFSYLFSMIGKKILSADLCMV